MELGISTASYFNKLFTEDAVVDIAAHGVSLAEVFLNSTSEYAEDFIDLLCRRLEESKLKVYSVHPMSSAFEPQLFSIHPRQREDAWALYERILSIGKRMGASCYVMHGAAHLSGAAKNLQMERIAPIFSDLAGLARDYGLTLALENVSWCVFCRPDFGKELSARLKKGAIKYTLDVKQALRAGCDPLDFVEAVGEDVVNLHLCDAVRTPGGIKPAMPGKGAYDFARLFSRLREKAYSGPAFIEVYSDMYQSIPELYESYEAMKGLIGPDG